MLAYVNAREPRAGGARGRPHAIMMEEKTTLEPQSLWYALSFIVPVVGIILGINYGRREAPESKRFGKKATVAAILGVLAYCALYAVFFIVLGAAKWLG
jgi:prolipoprotein diacylglyceryltransferase